MKDVPHDPLTPTETVSFRQNLRTQRHVSHDNQQQSSPSYRDMMVLLLPATREKMCLTLGWSDTSPPKEWFDLKDAKEAKAFLESQVPWLKDVPEETFQDLREQRPSPTTVVRTRERTY